MLEIKRGINQQGGGSMIVVSTAAFHARVRGSVPFFGGLKKTKKCFFPIYVCTSNYIVMLHSFIGDVAGSGRLAIRACVPGSTQLILSGACRLSLFLKVTI